MKAIRHRFDSFRFGFMLPILSARTILRQPSLMALSALPVAISLALYGFVILRLQSGARDWVTGFFTSHGWAAQGWALWLIQILLTLTLFLVSALTFSIVTSIVASPFNDFLAERAERYALPALPPTPQLRFAGKARLIAIDVAKTLAALAAGGATLIVSWVPVINAIAIVLTCLLVAFQYVSYPQTRRSQGLGYGIVFLFRHFFACVGFGAVTMILFSIPLLSVFMLPIAVVGGTLLVARSQEGAGPYPLR